MAEGEKSLRFSRSGGGGLEGKGPGLVLLAFCTMGSDTLAHTRHTPIPIKVTSALTSHFSAPSKRDTLKRREIAGG